MPLQSGVSNVTLSATYNIERLQFTAVQIELFQPKVSLDKLRLSVYYVSIKAGAPTSTASPDDSSPPPTSCSHFWEHLQASPLEARQQPSFARAVARPLFPLLSLPAGRAGVILTLKSCPMRTKRTSIQDGIRRTWILRTSAKR